ILGFAANRTDSLTRMPAQKHYRFPTQGEQPLLGPAVSFASTAVPSEFDSSEKLSKLADRADLGRPRQRAAILMMVTASSTSPATIVTIVSSFATLPRA